MHLPSAFCGLWFERSRGALALSALRTAALALLPRQTLNALDLPVCLPPALLLYIHLPNEDRDERGAVFDMAGDARRGRCVVTQRVWRNV